MELFVLIFYLIILIANIMAQFSKKFHFSTKYDFLLFINIFRLFSPNPITNDIRIFFRDHFFDNNKSQLIEFKYFNSPEITKSLWYFGKHEFYIIFRCLKGIKQLKNNNITDEVIFKSYYYKKIEFEIMKINNRKEISNRQIVFIQQNNHLDNDDIKIILVKNVKLNVNKFS